MKIVDVEAVAVSVPLREPLKMAVATVTARDCLVVRVRTEAGVEGVGEAVIAPYFTGETLPSALALVRQVAAPVLTGEELSDIRRLDRAMTRVAVGNSAARAAVDVALWDALARSLDVPLSTLLGGRMRESVPITWHLSGDTAEGNAEEARKALGEGFGFFKLKVGKGAFADELASVHAVREAVGDGAAVILDANQGWTAAEAVRFLDAVAGDGIAFVEQPVHRDDLRGLAWVQARTGITVVADEAVFEAAGLLEHVRADACRGVVGKLVKAGGVGGLVGLANVAEAAGIGLYLAGMAGETSISAAAGTHVAVSLGSLPLGTGIAPHYLVDDVVEERLLPVRGALTPPPGPGHGVTINEKALRRYTIDV